MNDVIKLEKIAYNTKEATEILSINRNLLDIYRRRGLIRAVKVGRYFIYPRAELERFIERNLGNEITKDGTIISGAMH